MVARPQFLAKYSNFFAFTQEQATTYSGNSQEVYHGCWFKWYTLVCSPRPFLRGALPCHYTPGQHGKQLEISEKEKAKSVTQYLNHSLIWGVRINTPLEQGRFEAFVNFFLFVFLKDCNNWCCAVQFRIGKVG